MKFSIKFACRNNFIKFYITILLVLYEIERHGSVLDYTI